VCFVTNNGFIDQVAFDGMRRHLFADFNLILHIDLKGNARTTGERRQREAGNIFEDQIRVGVGITLLVRNPGSPTNELKIYRVDDYLESREKTALVKTFASFAGTPLQAMTPNTKNNWINDGDQADFSNHIPLSLKGISVNEVDGTMFRVSSLGSLCAGADFLAAASG